MATIKDFLTTYGVTATYHKLIKVELNFDPLNGAAPNAECKFAVYLSADARDSGGKPLWYDSVFIPLADLSVDFRSIFYPLAEAYPDSYLYQGTSDQTLASDAPTVTIVQPSA